MVIKPKVLEKPCVFCGSPITWSKNVAMGWDTILFCSAACKRRANRKIPRDAELLPKTTVAGSRPPARSSQAKKR